jgi:hypothetical protein
MELKRRKRHPEPSRQKVGREGRPSIDLNQFQSWFDPSARRFAPYSGQAKLTMIIISNLEFLISVYHPHRPDYCFFPFLDSSAFIGLCQCSSAGFPSAGARR